MIDTNVIDIQYYQELIYDIEADLIKCKYNGINLDLNNTKLHFIRDLISEYKKLMSLLERTKDVDIPQLVIEDLFLDSVDALFHFQECSNSFLLWSINSVFGEIHFDRSGKFIKLIENYSLLLYYIATNDIDFLEKLNNNLVLDYVKGESEIKSSEKLWRILQDEKTMK